MEESSLQEKHDTAQPILPSEPAEQPVNTEAFARPDGSDQSAFAKEDTKPKRTAGLKLFDFFLYPVLTNTVVFVVSVAATYLTKHGNQTGGKVGQWFYNRGEKFENFVMKHGMSKKSADNAKMVAFSFLDGSVMAPAVKLIEDEREKIAHCIDKAIGTEPEDLSVYDKEPKQSWGSVLGGRIAALTLVLPTAVALSKFGTKDGKFILNREKSNPGFNSLNDHMFHNPGKWVGEQIEKKPSIAKYFGKLNIPYVSAVGFFEAFYTSLCTAVLYFVSRDLAKNDHRALQKKNNTTYPESQANAPAEPAPIAPSRSPLTSQEPSRPRMTLAADGTAREHLATLQDAPLHTLDGSEQSSRPSL